MTGPLPAYQQRVIDEHAELARRLSVLSAFIEAPGFGTVVKSAAERTRLARQEAYMTAYKIVLSERIAAFPPATGGAP